MPSYNVMGVAKAALEANGLTADIPALAESFVVARAIAKRTEKLLRAHTNEHGNIALHGGFIGYRASQSTKCPPEKAVALFADWTNRGGSANSFLIAMKGIGASQLDAIGKTIFKGRGAPALREEWAAPFVETETRAKWSVHTSNGDETTDEE